MNGFVVTILVVAAGGYVLLGWIVPSWLRLRRAEFIRTYKLPRGLLTKLAEHHPGLTRKECALVSRGLRQFFLAYLMSGKKFVSMPSVVADSLWHEFILYTREYQHFCRHAFGGFLHHTPAVVLSDDHADNTGLRRVWWYTCKYENIDPRNPTRLPLLFALDSKLNIPNGFRYDPDCVQLRKRGDSNTHCASDFSSGGYDGSTAGFGDSGSGGGWGGGDAGGGDGGGGGGGCGGGGGD